MPNKSKWFFCNWTTGECMEVKKPVTLATAIRQCGGWNRVKGFTLYTTFESFKTMRDA